MVGTVRWNIIVAGISMGLTFAFSLGNNPFLTSITRSLYCFIIMFILVLFVRWILGAAGLGVARNYTEEMPSAGLAANGAGRHIDFSTPVEADKPLFRTMNAQTEHKDEDEAAFERLSPPKLARRDDLDPEQLALALRQLTEE